MTRNLISPTAVVDNVDDVMASHITTLQNWVKKMWNTFAFVGATEKTISGGVITVTGNYHTVDTESDAASDDLDTISLGTDIEEASLLIIRPEHDDRTIVVKHGTGNILCVGGADLTLDDEEDFVIMIYDAGLACWLALQGGGGGGDLVDDLTPQLGGDLDLNGHSILDLNKFVCNGRLTLESGVPISTAEQVDKTNLYFTPYNGNEISLYDGAAWVRFSFAELTLAVGALTASKPYDIFIYDNAGTLTLSATEWTNASTRATALTTQDGVPVKTGATGYRYLGTIYIDAGQKCQHTKTKKCVGNYYNQVPLDLFAEEGTHHTYSGVFRKWNNSNTNNLLSFVLGTAQVITIVGGAAIVVTTAGKSAQISPYVDGAAIATYFLQFNNGTQPTAGNISAPFLVSAGYHTIQLYEWGNDAGCIFDFMHIAGQLIG